MALVDFGKAHVTKLIHGQISQSTFFFVLADIYYKRKRKEWFLLELEIAQKLGLKPIGVCTKESQEFPDELSSQVEQTILFNKSTPFKK